MCFSQFFFGIVLLLAAAPAVAGGVHFPDRFEKGFHSFGLQAGLGYTENLPVGGGPNRYHVFVFFPNFQKNLTGLVGKSWYRGTWNWRSEAGVASIL